MSNPPDSDAIARRNAIVVQWLWLVQVIAKHVMQTLPPCFDYDDLRQVGYLGLMNAAEKYDETRGVPFRYYAALRIRGEILESARRRRWTEATHLPITTAVLEMPGAEGVESIERSVEHAELARIVADAEQGLSETERQVLDIYFRQDGKLAGIGEACGVRQSRSSQLLQMSKRAMKRELAWRGVVDPDTGCTPDEMSGEAYERRPGRRAKRPMAA